MMINLMNFLTSILILKELIHLIKKLCMTRWDSSETERLPEYMKGLYMVVFETVNELAQEAEKTQGRDTLSYVRKAVWTIRIIHRNIYSYISF